MALVQKKKATLAYFSHFLVTREEKQKKKKSLSIYFTYKITRILLTLLSFFASPIFQKLRIYHVWFLFGATPGIDSYLQHFGAINK